MKWCTAAHTIRGTAEKPTVIVDETLLPAQQREEVEEMKKLSGSLHKRIFSFIICLIVALGMATPCFAENNDTDIVKVGFFAFDGYHMQDAANGVRSGYGYEILQHIAGYAGLQYEYIGYDKNWSEMQDMLANGEIDLLTSAQKTPEREARFDFTDTNIGVSAAILTVKAGDTSFVEEDYTNWDGIRVGLIEGNSRNESFTAYAGEHGFTYNPVYFDSTEEMIAELQSDRADKKIDAILTSNLRKIENEWILAQFDSSPFFVMVQKGNAELLNRINHAIAQLDLCEPGLRTKLMNKYYSAENVSEIAFTPEERAYIELMRGKTLTALLNPDRAPYSWYEDGAFHGIFYDIAQIVIQRTGLNVEFAEVHNRAEYQQLIDNGSAVLRFDMESTYSQAEMEHCWLTSSYMTVPLTRLYREDTTQFHSIAIAKNQSAADELRDDMQKIGVAIAYYASVEETLQAVMDGKQDMTYLAADTAAMAVRDDETNRFVAEEMFGQEVSYCVAVRYNQDPLLYSILTKAVSSLSDTEINAIRQGYTENLDKPFSFIGYFYDYPLRVALGVAVALGIAIIIIVLATQASRRKEELAHAKKDHEQNALLKDALAAAEKAGAAKSQFLSRVSHEMRTPLNAIIGFIELAKGADREQMENCIASTDMAAKQLLNVINDVLDMSSIESGKLKIASAPFNFRHLISSITNIYGTQCTQKGVIFETKIITPTEDWIVGDELRVNQILMNLLANAVKFTSEGHIWLTISETASQGNKLFLRFAVSDTGRGMSEEMMERLFRPFEQESAGTAKKYGGSGLGLSIVKNLVGMMDGTIKAESRQGEGTTFTVDLPFLRSNVEQQMVLTNKADALRILAVDDEKTERDYIGTVLRRMDIRYTCVNSGSEALAELERAEQAGDAYNVCLVDWQMPGMDGVEATSRIRMKYGNDMIVIVVSAYDFQQVGESAKEAGANLFVSKPIFQSSLFDLLMTLTDGGIAKVKEETKIWDFAGRRVLLVEDNALNQIVAKGYLSKCNVVVDIAEDGKIAVDKFLSSEPGTYDVILMDIQMPVMDGFAATKAIRESDHPEAKTIQIIAQTADAFNEDIAKALSAGMNAHVAKPIHLELLSKTLHKAFAAKDSFKTES